MMVLRFRKKRGTGARSFDAPWVVKQKMQMYRQKQPDVSFDAPWVVKHHGLTCKRTRPVVKADTTCHEGGHGLSLSITA